MNGDTTGHHAANCNGAGRTPVGVKATVHMCMPCTYLCFKAHNTNSSSSVECTCVGIHSRAPSRKGVTYVTMCCGPFHAGWYTQMGRFNTLDAINNSGSPADKQQTTNNTFGDLLIWLVGWCSSPQPPGMAESPQTCHCHPFQAKQPTLTTRSM